MSETTLDDASLMPLADPASLETSLKKKSNWSGQSNNAGTPSRSFDGQRFLGGPVQLVSASRDLHNTDEHTDSETISGKTQVEALVGSGTGLVIASILYWMLRNKYSVRRSLNPLYRTFKTLAGVGASLGLGVAYMLPFPKNAQKIAATILADIFSVVFGLVALPYWLIREYILKTPVAQRNLNAKTGTEGWSKYGKTFLVLGAALGQAFGALHSYISGANLLTDIAIGGGIAGAAAFFTGLVVVPLVNKCFGKPFVTDKNTFRNNYIRTGMVAGAAFFGILGLLAGTMLFPGLGSMAGLAIGSAIGSVIGGVIVGATGKKISQAMHPEIQNPKKKTEIENSWDYVTRSTAILGALIGTIIGFFIPVPGGALIGAALFAAVFSVAGWAMGFGVVKAARHISPVEKPANSLPWTQRMATGSNIFSVVGGILGCIAGLIFLGPAGALAGAALGYALGGVIGSIIGIFYDPKEKKKPVKQILSNKETELTSLPQVEIKDAAPQIEMKRVALPELKADLKPAVPITPKRSSSPVLSDEKSTVNRVFELPKGDLFDEKNLGKQRTPKAKAKQNPFEEIDKQYKVPHESQAWCRLFNLPYPKPQEQLLVDQEHKKQPPSPSSILAACN